MKPLGESAPRDVGRYRIFAELGQGGMGRVLLGSGPDGRLVALKVVREQLAADDEFRARFRREVDAARAVSGAYTAAVVDADPDAAIPWLASVFMPGPSLQDAIEASGELPQESVLRMAAGLATALIEIHRAGLVHRDVKPSNVLLADDGPRVIDFGIVRAVNGHQGHQLTQTGWIVGSPGFVSPEQAEGHAVGPASDVFSLGCVLVASCTGTSPFTGTSTLQTLYNVVHQDPDLSGLPTAIGRVAGPCLAKDPAARPTPDMLLELIGPIAPSARPWPARVHRLIAQRHAEIARLLGHAPPAPTTQDAVPTVAATSMDPDQTSTDTPGSQQPPNTPHTHRRSRRWLLVGAIVAALVLVLVVVLGLAGVLTSRPSHHRISGPSHQQIPSLLRP